MAILVGKDKLANLPFANVQVKQLKALADMSAAVGKAPVASKVRERTSIELPKSFLYIKNLRLLTHNAVLPCAQVVMMNYITPTELKPSGWLDERVRPIFVQSVNFVDSVLV